MSSPQPTGVCLLNMGGPRSLEDVQPFLLNLFSDRNLIRLPGGRWLQRPFARLISTLRTPKVQRRYAQIGDGSPLIRITRRALASRTVSWKVSYVSDYHDHPLYIDALAGTVQRGLDQLGPAATIVFSAHSLPQKLVDQGDPYQRQIESTVRAVVQKLSLESWHLAYQSRTGPVRWLAACGRRLS